VAVCPTDAIRISGRDLQPEDVFPIPPTSSRTAYPELQSLLLARRSTRNYRKEEVSPEIIQKILAAASTAAVGIPPSDVGVLVFQTRAAVREVRDRLLKEMMGWRWMVSPFMTALLRPFIGKENAEMFRNFIGPAINEYLLKDSQGIDWFFYDAPLALYFYGTIYNDPADTTIPATQAMLAGESLGLGTCMLGFPGYIFQYSRRLRESYRLPKKIQPGLVVIFGHPKYRNHNAIRRRFREVRTYGGS
jgi:nitroreductase